MRETIHVLLLTAAMVVSGVVQAAWTDVYYELGSENSLSGNIVNGIYNL